MCPDEKSSEVKLAATQARFVEGANDTVIERSKRLMWMKNDTYQLTGKWMSWIQVRDYAEELSMQKYGGLRRLAYAHHGRGQELA